MGRQSQLQQLRGSHFSPATVGLSSPKLALRGTIEGVNSPALYKLYCNIDSFCSRAKPNLLGWAVTVGLFLLYVAPKFFRIVRDPGWN